MGKAQCPWEGTEAKELNIVLTCLLNFIFFMNKIKHLFGCLRVIYLFTYLLQNFQLI